ncbi:hypothetical protein GKZ68_09250 [Hymenobacter sp. BRD128]|uniref:hypothetical protein n=1 Tax=Hymenobacter sp. BRD128 TaxID=2675878 RepID=UPI00156721B6|nr:hypothetical protein [Hymenobacter sp. BRD128]QKG56789.1 hypothetical protein GKZ68_09250 [Hymenobacter sp. BRD128]
MEDEKYPAWLADRVFTSFDWTNAITTSMQELLDNITLHDSGYYKTFLDKQNSWMLIIQLDAIWNKDFCHNLEDWPFLILRFQKVFCSFQEFTEYELGSAVIGDVEVTVLNGKDFDDWMDFTKIAGFLPLDILQNLKGEGGLTRTEISTVYGGSLSLVHAPAVEVLLYSAQGSQLAINLSA